MHSRPIFALAALAASATFVSIVSIGCSGAPQGSEDMGGQALHYSEHDIEAHQIVDLKAYLSAHPDISPEQALEKLNRPIKLEAGHLLFPKDLRLPERCMTQLDVRSSQFVADFETCVVEPSLFDPTEPNMRKMATKYLVVTGQVPDSLGSEEEALGSGTGIGDTPSIRKVGSTSSSCLIEENCHWQTVTGEKCKVDIFGLTFGCELYQEVKKVCDARWGTITCDQYENDAGGSFELCGDCK